MGEESDRGPAPFGGIQADGQAEWGAGKAQALVRFNSPSCHCCVSCGGAEPSLGLNFLACKVGESDEMASKAPSS